MIIEAEPNYLSLSHNPICFVFRSDEFTGATAYAYITLTTPAVNNWIEINGVRFTVATSANLDVDKINSSDATNSFVSIFSETPELNYKYRIRNAGGVAFIESLFPGEQYNIIVTGSSAWFSLVYYNGVSPNKGSKAKDYGVYLDIYQGLTGDLYVPPTDNKNQLFKIATQHKNYQIDNTYRFDLSGILSPYAIVDIPKPDLTSTSFQTFHAAVKAYYIEYGEMYSEYAGVGNGVYRAKYRIGESGVKKFILGRETIENRNLFPDPSTAFTLLTSNVKYKSVYNIELMAFLTSSNGISEAIKLEVKRYNNDGTITTQLLKSKNRNEDGVTYVRVDPASLGFAEYDYKYYSIRVYLEGSNVYVTDYIYYIGREECITANCFAFLNERGVYDTFSLAGYKEIKPTANKTLYSKVMPYCNDESDKTKGVAEIEYKELISYFSEKLTLIEFEFIKKIIKSTDVYLIRGTSYIPVMIDSFEFEENTSEDIFDISIKAYILNEENTIVV